MNSTKLFNFNFLKENIKKSKSLMAFFLGIIPLINILCLIVTIINSDGNIKLYDFQSLSIITYLGMYVLPIALSIMLFGFIFKRKSVDFVMSKPISRKSIYLTNTFGGILLLLCFITLNTLIFFLFSIFSTTIVIPFSLLIDYFIFWLCSYVFVFSLTTIALTLAGNFMGTMVAFMIVLCLFPFLDITKIYYSLENSYSNYIKCDDKECIPDIYDCELESSDFKCQEHLAKNEYRIDVASLPDNNYTAPLLFLMATDEGAITYNLASVIKMVVLSLLYLLVGFYLFLNRKMENNETSFKNVTLHYVLKCITLIPITFITYLIINEEPLIGMIVSIAVILVYSIIYDLVTRREIYKLIKSSLISLFAFGILLGIYTLMGKTPSTLVLDVKDIDYLTINSYGYKFRVTDKEVIKKMVKDTLAMDSYYASSTIANVGNKRYNLLLNISKSEDLLEVLNKDHLKKLYESFNIDAVEYIDGLPVTKELKQLVKETYKMLDFDNIDDSKARIVKLSTYQNHEITSISIPQGLNAKLDNYVLKAKSAEAVKKMNKYPGEDYYIHCYTTLDPLDEYLLSYVINENIESFKNYLLDNNTTYTTDAFEMNITGRNFISIVIGDKTKFLEEFNKYKNKLANTREYQYYLDAYYGNNEEVIDTNEY